jgi:hypothetical protein
LPKKTKTLIRRFRKIALYRNSGISVILNMVGRDSVTQKAKR